MIEVLVGADGRVRDAKVVKSIPALDGAAADAARHWTFRPAIDDRGNPVPLWIPISLEFPPADARRMKVEVIGGGETITLTDPMGRVAQATDTTSWSRIPACSTGVNPAVRSGDGWIKMDGGFFYVKGPPVGTWLLEVRRDAAPRFPEGNGPNVSIYAERLFANPGDWADERDQAWLALGGEMTWKIEVKPPPTPADSSWLHLVRVGRKGGSER